MKLDEALKGVNIGNITNPNLFGLVGFSRDSDSARGGVVIQNLTTPTSFIRSVDHLQLSGVHEDGYSAISIALKTMKFRPSTAKLVILVTDEDRDILNFRLDKDAVAKLLNDRGFKLTVLVQQSYVAEHYGDRLSGFVLGIDSSLKAYVLDTDAVDNYIVAQRGIPIPGTGFGTTYRDYVELALDSGGSAWDLRKIREGEPVLTAFTNAFVRVAAEDTLSTFESCFQCDCVLPEPDCTMSVTDIARCRGAVNPCEPGLGGGNRGLATIDLIFLICYKIQTLLITGMYIWFFTKCILVWRVVMYQHKCTRTHARTHTHTHTHTCTHTHTHTHTRTHARTYTHTHTHTHKRIKSPHSSHI